MKKKPPIIRFPEDQKAAAQTDDRHWHNGGDIEIHLYARSLHKAAKTLVQSLDLEPNTKTPWDACPVILLYRQSVELHLKVLVDEGSNFLKERTDSTTLYRTRSLRWLAQILCQIIKAVRWEKEFRCEGVASLSDFSSLVSEIETLDPVAVAVQSRNRRPDGSVPDQLQPPNVVGLAKKLDALLELLATTAGGLTAAWDLQKEGAGEYFDGGDDIGSTIH